MRLREAAAGSESDKAARRLVAKYQARLDGWQEHVAFWRAMSAAGRDDHSFVTKANALAPLVVAARVELGQDAGNAGELAESSYVRDIDRALLRLSESIGELLDGSVDAGSLASVGRLASN